MQFDPICPNYNYNHLVIGPNPCLLNFKIKFKLLEKFSLDESNHEKKHKNALTFLTAVPPFRAEPLREAGRFHNFFGLKKDQVGKSLKKLKS